MECPICCVCILSICIAGLKAQHCIAQGNALGFCLYVATRPVRAKVYSLMSSAYILLPFQGASCLSVCYPGRCPGLCSVGLSARCATFFRFYFGTSNWHHSYFNCSTFTPFTASPVAFVSASRGKYIGMSFCRGSMRSSKLLASASESRHRPYWNGRPL